MKLLGTRNYKDHALFNEALLRGKSAIASIEFLFARERIYIVPDNFKGTALDWERGRNRGEL